MRVSLVVAFWLSGRMWESHKGSDQEKGTWRKKKGAKEKENPDFSRSLDRLPLLSCSSQSSLNRRVEIIQKNVYKECLYLGIIFCCITMVIEVLDQHLLHIVLQAYYEPVIPSFFHLSFFLSRGRDPTTTIPLPCWRAFLLVSILVFREIPTWMNFKRSLNLSLSLSLLLTPTGL